MNVYSILICNSMKLGIAQMSVKRRMDTHIFVHLHNGILLSNMGYVNLKIIMLSERSQREKSTRCMIPFI